MMTESIVDYIICPEHKFIYGGVKYEIGAGPLPGTGACRVTYYDWFYCEKCLANKYVELPTESDTYGKILFNATLKPERK